MDDSRPISPLLLIAGFLGSLIIGGVIALLGGIAAMAISGFNPERGGSFTLVAAIAGVGIPLGAMSLLWFAARAINRGLGLGVAIGSAIIVLGAGLCHTAFLLH